MTSASSPGARWKVISGRQALLYGGTPSQGHSIPCAGRDILTSRVLTARIGDIDHELVGMGLKKRAGVIYGGRMHLIDKHLGDQFAGVEDVV
jgi:hypothetical protein